MPDALRERVGPAPVQGSDPLTREAASAAAADIDQMIARLRDLQSSGMQMMCAMRGSLQPVVVRPVALRFAADHDAERGVSACPVRERRCAVSGAPCGSRERACRRVLPCVAACRTRRVGLMRGMTRRGPLSERLVRPRGQRRSAGVLQVRAVHKGALRTGVEFSMMPTHALGRCVAAAGTRRPQLAAICDSVSLMVTRLPLRVTPAAEAHRAP